MNPSIARAALSSLYLSGASRLLRPMVGGVGAIVMLHRVRPAEAAAFQPNQALEITPEFLEQSIIWLKRKRYEFVAMDTVGARLADRDTSARFVSVTLDDGYRDNLTWAKPIFEKHQVPYAIYVPTDFASGIGSAWWLTLEAVVAENDTVEVDGRIIPCRTVAEKYEAYDGLKQTIRQSPTRADEIAFVRDLAGRHGVDDVALARSALMDWDELRTIAQHPLATIGAHTKSHAMLAKATGPELHAELTVSRTILSRELGQDIDHLAYPYGDEEAAGEREFQVAAELGYRTAVTTRPGVLGAHDGARLTALPRISIDGRYQHRRYLDVLVSGVAPAIWHALPRPGRTVPTRGVAPTA